MSKLSVAIDGPAGAGKSTIAKLISRKLGIEYIDTGAMYRAFTYKLIKNQVDFDDIKKVISVLKSTDINFINNHIYLDNIIIDEEIRDNYISKNVSYVAIIKEVREKLVELQRKLASNKSIVMDGRDIGSYVLPNSEFKFYITATPEERGKRRYKELIHQNTNINLDEIIADIKKRDTIDSTREFAPLIKSDDAILIDTTNKSIDESVDEILSYINRR